MQPIFPSACLIVLLLCVGESSQGLENRPVPYALSPVYLQFLENVESQLYRLLKESNKESNQEEVVRNYLRDYENSVRFHKNVSVGSTENVHDKYPVANNPILSMQMINRVTKYFTNDVIASVAKDKGLIEDDVIPGQKDIEDAMEALLRIQYIYDLEAHQLADGILQGKSTQAHLLLRECFELAKFAQESAYFTLALQWYDVTLKKLKQAESMGSIVDSGDIKEHLILSAMRETIDEHNEDYDESIKDGDMYSFSTPIFSTNYSTIAHLTLRKKLPRELKALMLPEDDPRFYQVLEANVMHLCDGQSFQTEQEKMHLKCWFDTKRHPYWTVNPLKIELLKKDPRVIQIYDIFNDAWVEYLKEKSYTGMEKAPVSEVTTPRTAAYAWFEDDEISQAPVSKTVEKITGLNVQGEAAAESLQVAAYAFGGHVEPHYDSRGPDDPEPNPRGDRVTTFLVYLSDVDKGGLTAFPLLGLHVKPVKNSAVLWYTNKKNGDVDDRTLHAACPVITGHKWIATKWTHINENVLKRPCGLRKDE